MKIVARRAELDQLVEALAQQLVEKDVGSRRDNLVNAVAVWRRVAEVTAARVAAGAAGINASVNEGWRYRECEGRPSHRAVWMAASMSSSCASVPPGSTLAITVACLPWVVAPPAVW